MKEKTRSVCPVCLRTIPAVRTVEGENVYLEKECPEHGPFRALVWEGEPNYLCWGIRKKATRPITSEGVREGCPRDCGLCGQHRQRTCCVLMEVTSRCNLRCPLCFANAGRAEEDPSLKTIVKWYDILREKAGRPNIQLSGGEPTVRDDLPEIIRMGREKGFTFFQLNTNGLRLAAEPSYAAELKEAGLDCVFLQFDGVTDKVYTALRGKPLLEEKCRAIDHCAAAGLGIVLVPVVVPDINLDSVGDIIRFAMSRLPVVKGVHFQPVSYFGRYTGNPARRVTLPRLLQEIERQTGGMLKTEYFLGGSAEHPMCSFSGNFVVEMDGTCMPTNTGSSCGCGVSDLPEEEKEKNPSVTAVEHARDTVAKRWGAEVPKKERLPEDSGSLDGMLYLLRHRRLSVSGMMFQDCWSMDLERLEDCYVHVLSPDGRVIPFCAYNLTAADGTPLYRK